MSLSAAVLKPRIRKYIPAPILSWRMNETSGPVSDYSGNGYTGRVDGTPTRAVSMGNGSDGIYLKSKGDGISIAPADISPVISAIRNGSYSQSIVVRNMGWSGAHTPTLFVIWNNSNLGWEVTLFIDYVPGSSGSWVHRAGWGSASATNIGNLSFSYAPSSFDSQTFLLTYVWDDVTRTKSLYRDGVLVTSAVLSQDYTVHSPSSERVQVGGHLSFPDSCQAYAKLSDLNIWDVALTASEVATLASLQGRTPDQRTNIDPYAASVIALLHFDSDANGSNTITNSAQSGVTFTGSGGVISNTNPLYGIHSAEVVHGSKSVNFSSGIALGAETAFTSEIAWRWNGSNSGQTIYFNSIGRFYSPCVYKAATSNYLGIYDGINSHASTYVMPVGAYVKIALVYDAGTMILFADGVEIKRVTGLATTLSLLLAGSGNFTIIPTRAHLGGFWANGHCDEYRFTLGAARYTATYTPQTTPFPNP